MEDSPPPGLPTAKNWVSYLRLMIRQYLALQKVPRRKTQTNANKHDDAQTAERRNVGTRNRAPTKTTRALLESVKDKGPAIPSGPMEGGRGIQKNYAEILNIRRQGEERRRETEEDFEREIHYRMSNTCVTIPV